MEMFLRRWFASDARKSAALCFIDAGGTVAVLCRHTAGHCGFSYRSTAAVFLEVPFCKLFAGNSRSCPSGTQTNDRGVSSGGKGGRRGGRSKPLMATD